MLAWWEHYAGPDDELCVLLFKDLDGLLIGLAPLYIHAEGKRRTVRLLGSGDASTNHTTWLAAEGCESSVANEVTRFLVEYQSGWDSVELDSVDAEDSAINSTLTCLEENGYLVHRIPRQSCWSIELPSEWEDYLSMLSKSHRKRCRKLQRELLKSGRVKEYRVTGENDFSKGFEIMLKLHAARWADEANPLGGFSDRRFRKFHEDTARKLLKQNKLRLTWLEYNDTPIAAEYQFTDNNAVYSYQAGMNPSITEFPPGNLSIMASIKYAIEQGYKSFDFSRGDQPYKSNWRAKPTACHDIRILPDNILGRVEYCFLRLCTMVECRRMKVVRWLKTRLSPQAVERCRQLISYVDVKLKWLRTVGNSEPA
jgi:CelD/BcsL family acetyltransferase involved in cellulose biosynthesis